MIDFFHRHQSALRRLSFLLLAAVLGLLLIAQLAAFAAARIFSYAMNRQHMLRGYIPLKKYPPISQAMFPLKTSSGQMTTASPSFLCPKGK